jgi:hypothetical protein
MANQTNATFAAMLKTLWFTGEIQNLALKNNPFLGMVPKKTDFYGDGLKIPLSYADLQGRSATFANAQAQSTPSKYAAFTITRAPTDYAIGRVDGETLETSQSNKGAFMAALEAEIKRGRNSITRSLAVKLFRSPVGIMGRTITVAGVTNSTFTVSTADSYNIEVGMTLGAVDVDTGAGVPRSGSAIVSAIDRQTSATTATVSFTGTITSFTSLDYVFVAGDYNGAISGLAAWVPDSAPSPTSFFGVNRTLDVTRLGGMRFTSSAPIEEAFQEEMPSADDYQPDQAVRLARAALILRLHLGNDKLVFRHPDMTEVSDPDGEASVTDTFDEHVMYTFLVVFGYYT